MQEPTGRRLGVLSRSIAAEPTPQVVAVFSAEAPDVAIVKCAFCDRVHAHHMPDASRPSYRQAPCSTDGAPRHYWVVPMTIAHAMRVLPPLPFGMTDDDALEVTDSSPEGAA